MLPVHLSLKYIICIPDESNGELGEASSSDSDTELETDAQEAVLFKQTSDEPMPGQSSSQMVIFDLEFAKLNILIHTYSYIQYIFTKTPVLSLMPTFTRLFTYR